MLLKSLRTEKEKMVGVLRLPQVNDNLNLDSDGEEDDSDGIFVRFSADVDSMAGCAATVAGAGSNVRLVVVEGDNVVAARNVGGAEGIVAGSLVGGTPDLELEAVDADTPSAKAFFKKASPLQLALRKIAVLANCDELLLAVAPSSKDLGPGAIGGSTGFGLSVAAPVVWSTNSKAPHKPAITCAALATSKPV